MMATHSSRTLTLIKLWLVWFAVYLISGAFLHQRIFSGTVERISSSVITLVVLNMPLQLILILVAVTTLRSSNATSVRIGKIVATLAVVLAAAHFLISIVTLWR